MKLIETEIQKSYTFYDNNTGHIIGPMEDIVKFAKAADSFCIRNLYTGFFELVTPYSQWEIIKASTRTTIHNFYLYETSIWPVKAKNVYVVNEHGDVIDFKAAWEAEWKAIRSGGCYKWDSQHYLYRESRDDMIRENLVIKKHNVDKIKEAYNCKVYRSNRDDREGYYCTARSLARIKTQSDHRKMAGVEKEDMEPEFRGKRRNLPNAWDEKMVGVFYNYKSWKHNSKRRKQWKE